MCILVLSNDESSPIAAETKRSSGYDTKIVFDSANRAEHLLPDETMNGITIAINESRRM